MSHKVANTITHKNFKKIHKYKNTHCHLSVKPVFTSAVRQRPHAAQRTPGGSFYQHQGLKKGTKCGDCTGFLSCNED